MYNCDTISCTFLSFNIKHAILFLGPQIQKNKKWVMSKHDDYLKKMIGEHFN